MTENEKMLMMIFHEKNDNQTTTVTTTTRNKSAFGLTKNSFINMYGIYRKKTLMCIHIESL